MHIAGHSVFCWLFSPCEPVFGSRLWKMWGNLTQPCDAAIWHQRSSRAPSALRLNRESLRRAGGKEGSEGRGRNHMRRDGARCAVPLSEQQHQVTPENMNEK